MSNLTQIESRHGKDRWKDIGFLFFAVLVIAVWVGTWTPAAAGKPLPHWTVQVVETPVEIVK